MTFQRRQLLETLLRLHDESDQPVSVARLAGHLDLDSNTAREQLDALCSYELVKTAPSQEGYLPTVTARELLELDIDDDEFVIIELPEDTDG